MKNAIFILSIFFCSCTKSDVPQCENCEFDCLVEGEEDVITNTCLPNYNCSFKLLPNSEFDKDEFGGFANGSKTVFQMITETEGDEKIADDEFTNILIFEIDEKQESFQVSEEELKNVNVHFKKVCFCSEVRFIAASSGCLKGQRQSDGSWYIQGKLTIPYSYGDQVVKVDARFE